MDIFVTMNMLVAMSMKDPSHDDDMNPQVKVAIDIIGDDGDATM